MGLGLPSLEQLPYGEGECFGSCASLDSFSSSRPNSLSCDFILYSCRYIASLIKNYFLDCGGFVSYLKNFTAGLYPRHLPRPIAVNSFHFLSTSFAFGLD